MDCESIVKEQNETIVLLQKKTKKKESEIGYLELKNMNLNTLQKNNKTSMLQLEKTIEAQKKMLKKIKLHKILLSIGLGTVTTIAIIK